MAQRRRFRRYFASGDPDAPEPREVTCRCGSGTFERRFICTGCTDDDESKVCGHTYTVEVIPDHEGEWKALASEACPVCREGENEAEVVCTKCGQPAPEYCRECMEYGCCCRDDDYDPVEEMERREALNRMED